MKPIKVLIVDDDPMARRALSFFFAQEPDIEVVGMAVDGVEAVSMVTDLDPDVVIMDVNMPNCGGAGATRKILADRPSTRVLVVTALGAYESVIPMLRAGASGYLLKDSEPHDIVTGVRQVHAGNGALSPSVTMRLIGDIVANPGTTRPPLPSQARLTERELAVIGQLAKGQSNSEISDELHLSEGSVKAYLGNIARKWAVRDRMQILIRATELGIVEPKL